CLNLFQMPQHIGERQMTQHPALFYMDIFLCKWTNAISSTMNLIPSIINIPLSLADFRLKITFHSKDLIFTCNFSYPALFILLTRHQKQPLCFHLCHFFPVILDLSSLA